MSIMDKKRFSPSVNIARDKGVELNYIPTPNAELVFNQIVNDYILGIRSFNIIGNYGTGKSAFLWAVEKILNGEKQFFKNSLVEFQKKNSFEFVHLIGDYKSLIDSFAFAFELGEQDYSTTEIIGYVNKRHKQLKKSNRALVIIIDEFGKFLEYAAKNNPEQELYFIQQFAEYINDFDKNILLITTLHQDFNSYSNLLTKNQRKEWDKVKGRLKELTFNEPVEQLLFLAAERINNSQKDLSKEKNFQKLFGAIKLSNAFPLRDYLKIEIAEKIFPLDILAASILTLSLQRYGQNERSLFSFLESSDYLGLNDFDSKRSPFYNLSSVFDYLNYNFYSSLSTKQNTDYTAWSAIKGAIERTEALEENVSLDAIKLVKAIGLLNIFSNSAAKLNDEFLGVYGKYGLGIKDTEEILESLVAYKIIRYQKHNSRYVLFEGTDVDIEIAINKAGEAIGSISNVLHHLDMYFDFPFVPAKKIYYEKGTPRFFAFRLSEDPETSLLPEDEIDGYINLIFSDSLKEKEIQNTSLQCEEAILFGYYKNTTEIKSLLYEIEKIKKAKEEHHLDAVAAHEFDSILESQIRLLNHFVIDSLYSEKSVISWYFNGKKRTISNRKSFNQLLSEICDKVYPLTPTFRSELVNRSRLTSPIFTARKNLIRALVANWKQKELKLEEGKFPPEKSIYYSLLKRTGIHHETKEGYTLSEPTDSSFRTFWNFCEEFLKSTKAEKKKLSDLEEMLMKRPYKLKRGFVDFWIPIFLFIKRNEFALFSDDGYIPNISDEVFDLIVKNPDDYQIKAFDITGERLKIFNSYRTFLDQTQQEQLSNQSFIETIKPFLTFLKGLTLYAKNTKKLDQKSIALRDAIANSKDPEKSFFVDFPKALGFTRLTAGKQLEDFVLQLQNSVREINLSYEKLINRFEQFLLSEIIGKNLAFPDYKNILQARFKNLESYQLQPRQKVFFQRLNSELDDRRSWLSSMAQACTGKALDAFTDDDEPLLYENLKEMIHELDNFTDISLADENPEREDIYKLEITSILEGLKRELVRIPKSKEKQVEEKEFAMKKLLTKDKYLNIAILTKLLKDQLNNGN